MVDSSFKPKSLAEILAPRSHEAKKKAKWRGLPGEPKPLWAILGDEPPINARLRQASSASGFGAVWHYPPGTPTGPKTCKDHYPAGSPERAICEGTGDNWLFNCIRGCLINNLPEGWTTDEINRLDLDTLIWLARDHPVCYARCAVGGL